MSNKYKILELLKNEEYTVKEIAENSEFNENEVRTYIHRLKEKNLIKEIGKKNRYIIYAAKEKESNTMILKQLYNLMVNKMQFIKVPNDNDIELIKKIDMVIK